MHLPHMPCLYGRHGLSLHGNCFTSGSQQLCDCLNFPPHSCYASQLACKLSCVPEVMLKRCVRTYLTSVTSTPHSPSLNPTMWTHICSFTNS